MTAESQITNHKKVMILRCYELQPGLVQTALCKALALPETTAFFVETYQSFS